MTDRERLIELKINFVENFDCGDCKPSNNKCRKCLSEKEADYLLEHGVIVLPCKAGDTMYCDGKFFADHCKGQIMSFPVDIVRTEVCSTLRGEIDMVFGFKRFGKDVFLTREEAEKAAKERESNE